MSQRNRKWPHLSKRSRTVWIFLAALLGLGAGPVQAGKAEDPIELRGVNAIPERLRNVREQFASQAQADLERGKTSKFAQWFNWFNGFNNFPNWRNF